MVQQETCTGTYTIALGALARNGSTSLLADGRDALLFTTQPGGKATQEGKLGKDRLGVQGDDQPLGAEPGAGWASRENQVATGKVLSAHQLSFRLVQGCLRTFCR